MAAKKIILFSFTFIFITLACANPIKIVAAENFYGQLAQEIGDSNVEVTNIISNPGADPHLFSTSPAIIKALNEAQIIILNGINYDPWMAQIIKSLKNKNIIIINVANLMHVKATSNPHIWYMPNTFPTVATVLADKITLLDPRAKASVRKNLSTFLSNNQQVVKDVEAVKLIYAGTKVTATEPVFAYMSDAMGLDMQGLDFQWKIMNDTEPSPKMLAQYEELLTTKKVKILFYNRQVTTPITKRILDLAKQNKIQVVGIAETMPSAMTINQWLLDEVAKTKFALKTGE